ncbi:MAG: carbohydrate kinase family protein [Chitinophagaceae bacterium]|nr:carbohydrate kinase family protein [Chitinophagaceae bacterium]
MQKVLILGGSTYDLKIYLDQLPGAIPQTIHKAPHREGPGSTGTGKALPLTYLGVPTVLYTAFGNDWYGRQIETFLHEKKIEFHKIIDPAGTQRHVNLMDKKGGRISMFITQSSERLTHDFTLVKSFIDACDIIVLNIIPYCVSLIDMVMASGKEVWTDLHDYDGKNDYHLPFLKAARFVQLSSDNLPDYLPVMQQMIREGKQMVVCTHGPEGATILTADGLHMEQQAISVGNIVDSNGAGDSFFAGLLYGYLAHKNWETAMRYAAKCGALAVTDEELCFRGLNASMLDV